MLRAVVVDNVWATRRLAELPNGAFLEVQVEYTGVRLVAFDVLGSGIGERVLVAQGSVAAAWFPGKPPPLDALIVGSIDESPRRLVEPDPAPEPVPEPLPAPVPEPAPEPASTPAHAAPAADEPATTTWAAPVAAPEPVPPVVPETVTPSPDEPNDSFGAAPEGI